MSDYFLQSSMCLQFVDQNIFIVPTKIFQKNIIQNFILNLEDCL